MLILFDDMIDLLTPDIGLNMLVVQIMSCDLSFAILTQLSTETTCSCKLFINALNHTANNTGQNKDYITLAYQLVATTP